MGEYYLTDGDVKALQDLLSWKKSLPQTRPGSQVPEGGLGESPDVYIARTPEGGVPALTVGVGAGENDVPGAADCQVWRALTVGGVTSLAAVAGLTRRVLNFLPTPLPADLWVVIRRDKFGSWTPDNSGDTQIVEWDTAAPLVDGYYQPGMIVRKNTETGEELFPADILVWNAN